MIHLLLHYLKGGLNEEKDGVVRSSFEHDVMFIELK